MVTMENAWILPALPLSAFVILALLNFAGIAQNLPRKGDFIAIIAIVLAFFGICVGFVRACDRLIASSTEEDTLEADGARELGQAAL